MIRIVLLGRTGNHLFQYAMGRVLAEKHGVPLVLDASWFHPEGWAEVSHFLKLPIRARVVRRCSLGARALLKLTGKHYWEFCGVTVMKEPVEDQSFDPRFIEAPADCMLFGYFQSPLYFESMKHVLRLELNGLLSQAVQEGSEQDARASCPPTLQTPNSVAVHVRRGDYLAHPALNVCDLRYYQEAMRRMRAHVPEARFHIFSDDPDWCRAHFKGSDQEVIDSGRAARNPLHDLHMMSLASHHIIANSSYSWWAAWLGEKPGQQVLMPHRWHAHDFMAPIGEKNPGTWEVVA
jgi:hypothetical protein